jgi:hypothetical protein
MLAFFAGEKDIVKLMRRNPERHWLKLSKIKKNKKLRHGVVNINVDSS